MSFLDELMGQKNLLGPDETPLLLPHLKKKGRGKKAKAGETFESCYKSHKPLHLSAGTLTGGSCSNPVEGADIYVNLDRGAPLRRRKLPWTAGTEFDYPIADRHAPEDPALFKELIEWLAERLAEGKHVHLGCIGGHGRTGTVIAALVKTINGTKDAITWVRENYCKKAVETKEQIDFLVKTFGIKAVEARAYAPVTGNWTGGDWGTPANGHTPTTGIKVYYPLEGNSKNIWALPKHSKTE